MKRALKASCPAYPTKVGYRDFAVCGTVGGLMNNTQHILGASRDVTIHEVV